MNKPNTTQQTNQSKDRYVGTIVGESTSREFRLAVAHETIREQDIIAIDAVLQSPNGTTPQNIRIWAKVQRIERINPLFPSEAGHELAATRTDPLDTVLSLSREMVTAVCQVLGSEPIDASDGAKLSQVRYPPQPASSAYRPESADIARILLGSLQQKQSRQLDIAELLNRPDVPIFVDGHVVATRHLAILAMTGAGKSWTARRVVEEYAKKNLPIIIFDPHGDYTGLGDIEELKDRVKRYYAEFPYFEEDSDTIAHIVSTLGYELSDTMLNLFPDIFAASKSFYTKDEIEFSERVKWIANELEKPDLVTFGIKRDIWLIAHMAAAGAKAISTENQPIKQQLKDWGWKNIVTYNKTDARSLESIKKRCYSAAAALKRMEDTNKIRASSGALPLPTDRKELIDMGQISVISLAGYTGDFQASLFALIAGDIFEKKVRGEIRYPVLLLLEEAHYFAPAKADTFAEKRAIEVTKQIAQEGRKFNVGLVLISQRPSRLDETTLSQCNSYIIMKLVNPADQNFVRKVVESLGEEEIRLLPNLDTGEAILAGQMISFPVMVKIKPPKSQGEHEEEDVFTVLGKVHSEETRKKKR